MCALEAEIREASIFDAVPIADNLRDGDKLELARATGSTDYRKLVIHSYKRSRLCWTAVMDNRPIVIFGVAPMSILSGTGMPWLLATDDMYRIKRQFLRDSLCYIDTMLGCYTHLKNYVDVENEASIRWLSWLGFELGEPVPYGSRKAPFIPFEMRA